MNIDESQILQGLIAGNRRVRDISAYSMLSVGNVSQKLNKFLVEGIIDPRGEVNPGFLDKHRVEGLVLLAAGPGLRTLPLDRETPKAFLRVRGETLIERLIRQAKEAGVPHIYVVVGYQKEAFEPLIDRYGVKLLVNPSYAKDDNLLSALKASPYLNGSYICPADLYFRENPFRAYEFVSWYLVEKGSRGLDVSLGPKKRLTWASAPSHRALGLAYLNQETAKRLVANLTVIAARQKEPSFWEKGLYLPTPIDIYGKVVPIGSCLDINSYEDLSKADPDSPDLLSSHIRTVLAVFESDIGDISDVRIMKKGMTNRSFLFRHKGEDFIMRLPGEGTESLIDRKKEFAAYQAIRDLRISDDVIYMDPDSGVKITRFIEGTHNCDPNCDDDVRACMAFLRSFHRQGIKVGFDFDLFQQIDYYESLWDGKQSAYLDYPIVKERVRKLRGYVDSMPKEACLAHIDAVPDNFLLSDDGTIRLIDWEYAADQDPHVDIAMFAIYSGYDKNRVDWLIDQYFDGGCDVQTRGKIYCYVAICGLLWSNWCEYKQALGVEFGEYSLNQYRYAKEYSRIVLEAVGEDGHGLLR